MILKFKDGELLDIHVDEYCDRGCPTCDYGREYCSEVNLYFSDYEVHIEIADMSKYPVSVNYWIKLFAKLSENCEQLTQKEFIDKLKESIDNEEDFKHLKYPIEFEVREAQNEN